MASVQSLDVIDSHTAGEPTRTVVGGLHFFEQSRPIGQQLESLRKDFDWVRKSLISEPRGSDVMVGALLLPATAPDIAAGVIFFNNVGYLGMCGHGMIGVITTLAWLGRIEAGRHLLDTPVGRVACELAEDGQVRLENVSSYRYRRDVPVELSSGQVVHGDIAWGGNWFFLCDDHGLKIELANVAELTAFAEEIRRQLDRQAITGQDGGLIDHIELVSNVSDAEIAEGSADYVNFVLCPGLAYDRSPCGTGTSAKVACLAADGKLVVGETVRVRGISGESFSASYQYCDAADVETAEGEGVRVKPLISGRAYVNGRTQILFDPADPFRFGM